MAAGRPGIGAIFFLVSRCQRNSTSSANRSHCHTKGAGQQNCERQIGIAGKTLRRHRALHLFPVTQLHGMIQPIRSTTKLNRQGGWVDKAQSLRSRTAKRLHPAVERARTYRPQGIANKVMAEHVISIAAKNARPQSIFVEPVGGGPRVSDGFDDSKCRSAIITP